MRRDNEFAVLFIEIRIDPRTAKRERLSHDCTLREFFTYTRRRWYNRSARHKSLFGTLIIPGIKNPWVLEPEPAGETNKTTENHSNCTTSAASRCRACTDYPPIFLFCFWHSENPQSTQIDKAKSERIGSDGMRWDRIEIEAQRSEIANRSQTLPSSWLHSHKHAMYLVDRKTTES